MRARTEAHFDPRRCANQGGSIHRAVVAEALVLALTVGVPRRDWKGKSCLTPAPPLVDLLRRGAGIVLRHSDRENCDRCTSCYLEFG